MATTGRKYTPARRDLGYRIRVGVKATNADGSSKRVWSEWSPVVRKRRTHG